MQLYLCNPQTLHQRTDGNEIELYIDVPDVDQVNNPELIAAPIKPLQL